MQRRSRKSEALRTTLDFAALVDTIRRVHDLRKHQVPTCDPSLLYAYAAFFRAYPQIQAVAAQTWPQPLPPYLEISEEIFRSLTGKLGVAEDEVLEHGKVRTASAQFAVAGGKLLSSLSYSHFEELVAIENPLKRAFYEIECIRGNWSVRALKRQISSLYFERSALVEYALPSMNNRLFVSKHQLELPSTETPQEFLDEKRKEVGSEI